MQLLQGDCLEAMKGIPDKSIDMVLCDLPYGTTACKWDVVIPFAPLWKQYNRVIKNKGCIALFGSEPFSSYLRMSNIKKYKYDWVWDKKIAIGFQVAKYRPMQQHENILIFGNGSIFYYPIMVERPKIRESRLYGNSEVSPIANIKFRDRTYMHWYPKSIIVESGADHSKILHPTQKPVALLEYLIKTYTLEGETILDNCMGSGSTGVACMNTSRDFVGIELDQHYYEVACKRIAEAGAIKNRSDKLIWEINK